MKQIFSARTQDDDITEISCNFIHFVRNFPHEEILPSL